MKNQFKAFITKLHEQAEAPIYFAPDTSDLAKEVHENCVKWGFPAEIVAVLEPIHIGVWLEILRNSAKRQLTDAKNSTGILLYVWHDPQAGQLRYNFINPRHKALPFTAKVNLVDDSHAFATAFLDVAQGRTPPDVGTVLVYQRKLQQKSSFEFKSYAGWGPVGLGMTMQQVRDGLQLSYSNFRRNVTKPDSVDAFDDSAFMVNYNEQGRVKAIELTKDAQLVFEGVELIGKTSEQVRRHVESKGYVRHPTNDGSYYKDLGLYFNGSSGGKVSNMVVFATGYYEDIESIM